MASVAATGRRPSRHHGPILHPFGVGHGVWPANPTGSGRLRLTPPVATPLRSFGARCRATHSRGHSTCYAPLVVREPAHRHERIFGHLLTQGGAGAGEVAERCNRPQRGRPVISIDQRGNGGNREVALVSVPSVFSLFKTSVPAVMITVHRALVAAVTQPRCRRTGRTNYLNHQDTKAPRRMNSKNRACACLPRRHSLVSWWFDS